MASETVRALLNHVWSALEPLGYPCALMGGAALAVWNHPRATRDIDLLISVQGEHIDRVIAQLKAAGCRTKNEPPVTTLGDFQLAQFLFTPPGEFYDAQFDLWLAQTDFQKSAMDRRVSRKVDGVAAPIFVLNCDDLIIFKLLAGRMIDRADAATLLRENIDAIDLEYVKNWVSRLELQSLFGEVWLNAFPDKALPEWLQQ